MIENFWKDKYPAGIAAEINPDQYPNILSVLKESCQRFATKPAFTNLGKTLTYGELYKLSGDFAAYLQQHTDLKPGDRIAVQLPNVLQYPIVVFGAMRAGLIVVNTNPLYTARELEHQFNDSGAKAVVCLANMAHLVEGVLPKTGVKQVIVTEVGDILPPLKRFIVNFVVKHIKKMVPAYSLPQATKLTDALARGAGKSFQEAAPQADDVAVLQYTGGTTGVAKGAMLTHGNLLSNLAQSLTVAGDVNRPGEEVVLTALPLYHIFAFTYNLLSFFQIGGHNILIPSPRPVSNLKPAFEKFQITRASGVNVLFAGLLREEWFRTNPPRHLEITISGGTALHSAIAEEWQKVVGGKILEGYGLSETSPTLAVNPIKGENRIGTIGIPMPSTEIRIVDEQGNPVPPGQPGELVARGPQVFKGYWNRPEETEAAMRDGWFHTGDIAIMDERGYLRIVDRKKDLIDVSGFNVYPNEVEDCIARIPAVAEVAVIGVPLPEGGERVRAYVVSTDPNLTEEDVIKHCRQHLTAYKVPKEVIFREELPKTPVGKVLRKDLRAEVLREIGKT